MRKKHIAQKLYSLFTGELFAVIMFAVLWVLYLLMFDWAAAYLASLSSVFIFVVLEFILLQGSYYWFFKWKQVRRKDYSALPARQLRWFSRFRKCNLAFLAIALLIQLDLMVSRSVERYWCLFLYLFALVEYINYYHVRLSFMSISEIKEFIRQKGFRSSKLAKELKNRQREAALHR
ncbi:hypothetical protein [Paenibacillus graminis]|uniref:Membrane protein n=1 Tax=Paenibacillus graminis TaxID=189425 RepID=A0A089M5Z5_9BACL|nr:hypothetical protein [Paenibacillus graminis]AIQ67785.1 membrane protein [Paenibacillus graminis]